MEDDTQSPIEPERDPEKTLEAGEGTDDDGALPPKREVFLHLLREGSVFVHLDARKAGVMLPSWLLGEMHVVLEYGYDLAVPITDLVADPVGIAATLSFRREPHRAMVPWTAVFGITTQEGGGLLWPEEIPPEVKAKLEAAQAVPPQPAQPARPARARSPLGPQPVRSQAKSDGPGRSDTTEPAPRKERPSHLKLVK
jgi:hypothetical protein